jgi:rifampicin phosphotransferase
LFAVASGIVVNVGAAISHAVIVARELGVPCAISVTGATDRIRDGALIEVDGGTGQVRVVG